MPPKTFNFVLLRLKLSDLQFTGQQNEANITDLRGLVWIVRFCINTPGLFSGTELGGSSVSVS